MTSLFSVNPCWAFRVHRMREGFVSLQMLIIFLMFSAAVPAVCQDTPSRESPQTLQVGTHLTIEDVVVTDRTGKAMFGLPQSAFHVRDDGVAQSVRNFEESSNAKSLGRAVPQHGVFSNAEEVSSSRKGRIVFPAGLQEYRAEQVFADVPVRGSCGYDRVSLCDGC
jgi:hypothetical protein